MKKPGLVFVLCSAFLMNSTASAIMSPKRLWGCVTRPDKNNCSESERKTARGWIIGGSITAIVAVLTAIGIVRGPQAARDGRRMAADAKLEALRYERNHNYDDPVRMREIDLEIEHWTRERNQYN